MRTRLGSRYYLLLCMLLWLSGYLCWYYESKMGASVNLDLITNTQTLTDDDNGMFYAPCASSCFRTKKGFIISVTLVDQKHVHTCIDSIQILLFHVCTRKHADTFNNIVRSEMTL